MNELFDTHAHIHFPDYGLDRNETWQSAKDAGVTRMLAVGCRIEDSLGAVEFARGRDGVWVSVGIHPHEAETHLSLQGANEEFEDLLKDKQGNKIVAIGECGLDYFYEHSKPSAQKELLEWQLGLAEEHDLPVIYHVRDAFEDFWPIFDAHNIKKGVVHSFTGVKSDVDEIIKRGLYIGLNGIVTFTKKDEQLEAAKAIPLDNLVLETDAPFLTPKPFRGKICKPEHVKLTADFLAGLRNEPFEQIAERTTMNAQRLFSVK